MDEHGIPKYKGRKRGRKPKLRKRKANPNRRKRQHTAYTLFVKEVYPGIRHEYPGRPSKELISMVAKQWADVPAEEKKMWKDRAIATHGDGICGPENGDIEDLLDDEEDEDAKVEDDEAALQEAVEEAYGDGEEEDDDDMDEVDGANLGEVEEDVDEGGGEEDEGGGEDDEEDAEEPAAPARRRTRLI